MPDVREVVQLVLRQVFDDDRLVLTDSMSAKDFEDWDSLQHINIVIAIEKALSIRFTTSEIARLKQPDQTIGSFLALLQQKVAAH